MHDFFTRLGIASENCDYNPHLHRLPYHAAENGGKEVEPIPFAAPLAVFELHAASTPQRTEERQQQAESKASDEVFPAVAVTQPALSPHRPSPFRLGC